MLNFIKAYHIFISPEGYCTSEKDKIKLKKRLKHYFRASNALKND